jgi:ABC-type phosphate transport system substrate-binding protein
MRKYVKLVATATMAVCASALVIGPAVADPINGSGHTVKPKETDIVGVGADTNEFLFDQLSLDYNKAFPKKAHVYSWDALNAKNVDDNIVTKSGCSKILRPDGASAGVTAFIVNQKTKDKKQFCIDYVRAARGRSSSDPAKGPGGIVYVALAKDAITYMTNGGKAGTHAPKNLSATSLAAIYNCTATKWNQVGGTSSATIKPFLPVTGSGLRTSFLKDIGVTAPGTCVNSTVQQNEGTDSQLLNNPNALVPYSVAKFLTQEFRSNACKGAKKKGKVRFGCDEHGDLKLNSINKTSPTVGKAAKQTINPKFSPNFINPIYDVVRWAKTSDNIPAYLEPLFAPAHSKVKGWLCTNKTAVADLTAYGFLTTPFCGTGS